jgi:hypothetical protein
MSKATWEEPEPVETWNGFLYRARDGDVPAMQCLVRLEIDHGSAPEDLDEETSARSSEE